MSAHHTQAGGEPELMARKFFILTSLGVVAFLTAVTLVVRYMPSNDGFEPAPIVTPQHVAAHP